MTSTYVSQVKWVSSDESDSKSPLQLTFIGNSSKSPITIDTIIEKLCECQESATKKDNNEKFEALYKLILERLPMSCPSYVTSTYFSWTWLNTLKYPFYSYDIKICEMEPAEFILKNNVEITEGFSKYIPINFLVSELNTPDPWCTISYEFTCNYTANTSKISGIFNKDSVHFHLVNSPSLSPGMLDSLEGLGSSEFSSKNVTINNENSTITFNCTAGHMLMNHNDKEKTSVYLYIDFGGNTGMLGSDESITLIFNSTDNPGVGISSRSLSLIIPSGDNAATFDIYQRCANINPYTIKNKEDYEKISTNWSD